MLITYLIFSFFFTPQYISSDDTVDLTVSQIEIQDPVLLDALNFLIHKRKELMIDPPYVEFRKSNFGNSYVVDIWDLIPGYSPDLSIIKYFSVIDSCTVYFMDIPLDSIYIVKNKPETFHLFERIPYLGAAWSQHFYYIPFNNVIILYNGLYGE